MIKPFWLRKIYWNAKAYSANLRYGFPAKDLNLVGITGTNGKTTSCYFMDSILTTANFKVARMTTIDYRLNDTPHPNPVHLTSFAPMQLQKFLSQAVSKKIDWTVLELSSHGLAQNRAWGLKLKTAAITYISREHLDFHGNVKEYIKAKAKIIDLIEDDGFLVLNRDYKSFNEIKPLSNKRIITFGILRGDIKANNIEYKASGSNFLLNTPKGNLRVSLNIPGRFNVYNALCAAALAYCLGIELEVIRQGLEAMDYVPGRMEEIENNKGSFRVIVDYVHTPDSLALVLEELKQIIKGRLIIVFGMPGERDTTNRPLMGQMADKSANIVIITDENPRHEKSMDIINQIAQGVKNKKMGKDLFKILDRKEAIKKAFSLAQAHDLVLIAGKGPENYIEFADKTIEWDDRLVAKKLLKKSNL